MQLPPHADASGEIAFPFPLSQRIVQVDRIPANLAGAATGVLGGIAMTLVTDALMGLRAQDAHPFLAMIAAPFNALPAPWPIVAGVALAAVAGGVIGSVFAGISRRLKKLVPLLFWTALLVGALWVLIDAVLVAKLPDLAARLPFFPILGGMEVFAVLLCAQLPVRLRRATVDSWSDDDDLEE